MAIVLISIAPSRELYDQVVAKLGDEPPPGNIIHTASMAGAEMRIVDVWESAEQAMASARDRLGLAIASVGGDMLPPEILEVFDLRQA